MFTTCYKGVTMYCVRMLMLLSMLMPSFFVTAGCAPDTLVATPSHIKNVQILQVRDLILCRTPQGTTLARPVDIIRQRHVNEVIHVVCGDDELDVAVDQRFLLSDTLLYITADQLTTDHRLVNVQGNPIVIDHIERRQGAYSLIMLSVNEYHTFFVTKQGIVLHNNVNFVINAVADSTPAKVALTGVISVATIPLSVPAAAGVILIGGAYHMRDQIVAVGRAIGRGFAWLFGMSMSIGDDAKKHLKKTTSIRHALHEIDKMAEPEPNGDGTYRIYDPSSKHYPVPQKGESPGPGWIAGQLALNASWEVKKDSVVSTMRISYCQGRIVMFKLTYCIGKFKVYHGYYQTEDDLDSMNTYAQRVLREKNVINHRNKIIK